MDAGHDAMAVIARVYLGREATPEERTAMADEMARDGRAIAPDARGRDGGLFPIEPADFYRRLNAEAGR